MGERGPQLYRQRAKNHLLNVFTLLFFPPVVLRLKSLSFPAWIPSLL